MQRIRYEKSDQDDILVSVRNLYSQSTGAMYIVYLNTKECTYRIKNINSKRNYTGGDDLNNIDVLKRHVKKRLIGLGVEFNIEVRNK